MAIRVDARGRVSVGEIPVDQVRGLEPARDIAEALSLVERALVGADEPEEREFGRGFESARPPLPVEDPELDEGAPRRRPSERNRA